MLKERPIPRQYRGPAAGAAAAPATGGDNLEELIGQADALRQALGYQRWADLSPLCDGEDPKTLDQRGLVRLIGQLGSMQRGQRHV